MIRLLSEPGQVVYRGVATSSDRMLTAGTRNWSGGVALSGLRPLQDALSAVVPCDACDQSTRLSLLAHPCRYRGASLIKSSAPLGAHSKDMPRALWWSLGGGLFLVSEVPL